MGICSYCIYRGDEIELPTKLKPDFRPDWAKSKFKFPHQRTMKNYVCKNPDNADVDTVTGEYYYASCRSKNRFGECLLYDDGSVPFFAWKKEDNIVFTLSETPNQDDKYFDNEGTELGVIVNISPLFAWKQKEESEEETPLYYTLSEGPQLDYDVFEPNGNVVGKITGIEDDVIKITIDESEIEYIRNEEADINTAAIVINSDFYFRDADDDTKIIIPEEEPSEEPEEPIDPEEPDEPVDPIEPVDPEPTDPDVPDPIEP